nr:unnamed protein product [Callosobruchus analis]
MNKYVLESHDLVRKESYIQGLVKIETVQRRRGAEETSKRNFSLKYHLKVNNTEIRVCKQMFLKSLGMKESTVLNWVKLDKSQEAERRSNDKRGEARRNHYQSRSLKLIDFFKSPQSLNHIIVRHPAANST